MTRETYKELRKRLGLTQAGLAHELGLARETIAQRESGAYPIGKEAAVALHGLVIAHDMAAGLKRRKHSANG